MKTNTTNRDNLYFWGSIGLVSALSAAALIWCGPISQDPAYHGFADRRTIFGVTNFWDVITNLPFILVGLLGLTLWLRQNVKALPHGTFFLGALLTGLGSAYYHLAPTNQTLLWDRLPMAITFMAFLSIIFYEFTDKQLGKGLLLPLLLAGMGSVFYWFFTEQAGAGDLRPYILVQYLPILLIPIIISFFKSSVLESKDIYIVLALYGFAKILELFDHEIFLLSDATSGHSLKHLVAAYATYWILHVLCTKKWSDMNIHLLQSTSNQSHNTGAC